MATDAVEPVPSRSPASSVIIPVVTGRPRAMSCRAYLPITCVTSPVIIVSTTASAGNGARMTPFSGMTAPREISCAAMTTF